MEGLVDSRTVVGLLGSGEGLLEIFATCEMIFKVKPLIMFFSSFYNPAPLQDRGQHLTTISQHISLPIIN